MPKKNSLKEVPFRKRWRWLRELDEDGRQVRVSDGWEMPPYASRGYTGIEWRPNEPFEATLKIVRLERGHSAARFWFEDENGTEYPMFGQGLVEMLESGTMDHGVTKGIWIGVKRGANYGIERYEPDL